MADFAAAGRAHAAGLADGVGREVVVQHEGLLAGAFQAVDELLVLGGAQGGDDQRLGLAAGEQRRAMGARQDADFGDDGTHGGEIAAVDALLGVEHRVAHDIGFDVVEQAGIAGGNLAFAFADEFGGELLLDGAERVAALELDRDLERGGQFGRRFSLARIGAWTSSGTARGSFAAFSARRMMALMACCISR